MLKKNIPIGTIRVNAKSLKSFKMTAAGWKLFKKDFPELNTAVKLFKVNNRFKTLIDLKNPLFLKGELSKEGQERGARINILPNGKKLEKAFSLFSPYLKIHDQDSHDHWDVIYKNKGGTFSYVYTLEKRKQHQNKKYKKVHLFAKHFFKLRINVTKALKDKYDEMAVPMHTLLNTNMRIGNEIYYKAHGHKGLTTLVKGDVKVKGNGVTFNYVGKDGVPIQIFKHFSPIYISRLKYTLKQRKTNDFVFSINNRMLYEQDFKKAFQKYCGHEFYPHIVRSHFATIRVEKFLKNKSKVTKEESQQLFLEIAHELGHKKFNKKTNEWQDHYAVTVNSYIRPELVETLNKRII